MEQASDVAGTGAKALTFTDVHTKQGTLTSVGTWTKVTQSAAATYTDATSAEAQAIWVVEFDAMDLDVGNDFVAIRGRVADVGTNAQIGCMFYLAGEPRYGSTADAMPSAIA